MYRLLFIMAFMLTAVEFVYAQSNPALTIPAFTAYSEPDPDAISFSETAGVSGWTRSEQKLSWYGYLKQPGTLSLKVSLTLPEGASTTLKLECDGKQSEATATGAGDKPIELIFDDVPIKKPGYYRFTLVGIRKSAESFGDIKSLSISGAPAELAHFNLKERRNAASVHLVYPIPADAKVTWFYNEVTVKEDPIWSYYMACGFRRGYFGIQVNSPTERRIIFSIWDSGNEGVDRSKVSADDRVQLLDKGEGVVSEGFGNEGTGGHSHLVYPWKTGKTYRFLVKAEPQGTHTVYSGWFYFPEKKRWGLIASFRAPKDGNYLRGLYSFNENFGGANGELKRLAEFGNQWVKMDDGKWLELTTATFSHDGTGKADRLDRGAGTKDGRFYLWNGGFSGPEEPMKFGEAMNRPPTQKAPSDFEINR